MRGGKCAVKDIWDRYKKRIDIYAKHGYSCIVV